jgi:hypothetical protein
MRNTQLVFITSDTDCDGTTYGAHRIAVPEHLATDESAALRYVRSLHGLDTGRCLPRDEEIVRVMALRDFLREFGQEFSYPGAREQFCGAPYLSWNGDGYDWTTFNYASLRSCSRWNPWVFDDSIGIPALDSRYDEDLSVW